MWVVLKHIAKVGSNRCKGLGKVINGNNGMWCRMLSTSPSTSPGTLPGTLNQQSVHESDLLERTLIKVNPLMSEAPYLLTTEQQEYIVQGIEGGLQKWMELSLELFIKREKGYFMPDSISLTDLKILMTVSPSRRRSFMKYLWGKEMYKNKKATAQLNKQPLEWPESTSEYPWLDYRMHGNVLFDRICKHERTMKYNANAVRGLQFGQKIILDCSYNHCMDDITIKRTAKQILRSYYSTRKDRRPFSLHLCNMDVDNRLRFYLEKMHPGYFTNASIGIHPESYLEVFGSENLVYLSPDSRNILEYNPNDTYILGAYVDTTYPFLKLSAKKAGLEKIRHAKLPIDNFLKWEKGSKSLCINHCFDILQEVKNTGDWLKALQENIPTRKVHAKGHEFTKKVSKRVQSQ